MTVLGCMHQPPCPTSCSRWQCSKRTEVEAAILKGIFTREEAQRFLAKFGVPLTPLSRVYKGERPLVQKRLI